MKSVAAIVRSGLAPSGHTGCGLEHFRGLAPSLLGPQIAVMFWCLRHVTLLKMRELCPCFYPGSLRLVAAKKQ
jgi:hypothetical protein